MPPVLDPKNSKLDGLAFLGLSLCRKSERGHADSGTHQQAFDLDRVQDREYQYLYSSNDDGWLVGGGEPGPPHSYKLPARDSAHVEIMRIGTYNPSLGGLDPNVLLETLRSGRILIPEMTVVPTAVVPNGDRPPELEIRFDMLPHQPNLQNPLSAPLPINWQLRFVHNQLFHAFQFPSRFCPGAFHSTILRKAEFRSKDAEKKYFAKCQSVVQEWLERGQQPLVPPPGKDGVDAQIKIVECKKWKANSNTTTTTTTTTTTVAGEDDSYMDSYYRSGIWLFTDRNNPTHQILPNFLPPYDTPAKRKIILDVLKEEWDETTLMWRSLYDPPEHLLTNILLPHDSRALGDAEPSNDGTGGQPWSILCGASPPDLCGSKNHVVDDDVDPSAGAGAGAGGGMIDPRQSMVSEFGGDMDEEKSSTADVPSLAAAARKKSSSVRSPPREKRNKDSSGTKSPTAAASS
jgi:hypothetical protein